MQDFASEYGIRLSDVAMLWPEFATLTHGLLTADSRLARFFRPDDEEPEVMIDGA